MSNLQKAAKVINALVARGEDAGKEYFVQAGERLIEIRAKMTGKLFETWVNKNIVLIRLTPNDTRT